MIEFKNFEHDEYDDHGPEITPLIDMVFLLLIFFLLTSYYSRPQIPVELPESDQGLILPESPLLVTIQKNGTILLDGAPVPLSALLAALGDLLSDREEKEVGLQVGLDVPFQDVIEVMDIAKESGAEHFRFIVEKKPEKDL
ncbi:MAG: biopolymer transporter ExbD [Spirochaetales bacterium]|nr:biopolymer transporter ExbD [Spirochaetales bacterium]